MSCCSESVSKTFCLEAEQEQLWHVHALVASYRELEHHRQAIRLLSTLPSTTCRRQEWSIAIVWLQRRDRQIQWTWSQAGKAANAPPPLLLILFLSYNHCPTALQVRIDSHARKFLSLFQSIFAMPRPPTTWQEQALRRHTGKKLLWSRGIDNKLHR